MAAWTGWSVSLNRLSTGETGLERGLGSCYAAQIPTPVKLQRQDSSLTHLARGQHASRNTVARPYCAPQRENSIRALSLSPGTVYGSLCRSSTTIYFADPSNFLHHLMLALCTTVPNTSASSARATLVSSSPCTPGMSRSPIPSSTRMTSYPFCIASRAVVDTQTWAM
jgi:hypothetical protein